MQKRTVHLSLMAMVLLVGCLALTGPVSAEKNLYLGVNAGASLFSPGLYSNREIHYEFDSLTSVNKTPSILYTVPSAGVNASLVLSETWIIGYSGSIAHATWLQNPTTQKIEVKKCGNLATPVACQTLDPHFSPTFTFDAKLTRTEHDLSLTRRFNNSNWLVFAALRYQYYSVNGERPAQENNDTTTTKIIPSNTVVTGASGASPSTNTNYSAQSYGGAVGIGYTMNFFQNWYLNMQTGFLILKGNADYFYARSDNLYSLNETNRTLGLGASGALSLGYSVTGTHIILLSYKFQVFRLSALGGNRITVDRYNAALSSSDNLFSDGAVDVVNTVTLAYIYKVF